MKHGLVVFVMALAALDADAAANPRDREAAATNTVKEFYRCLLGTQATSTCPKLFDDPELFLQHLPTQDRDRLAGASASAALWDHLRAHKQLFSFWSLQRAEEVDTLRLSFRWLSFEQCSGDGPVTAIVSGTLTRGGNGIFKEVSIPLERGPVGGPPFLINIVAVRINGISVAPAGREIDWNSNFFRALGFTW